MIKEFMSKHSGKVKPATKVLAILFCVILVFNLVFSSLSLNSNGGLKVSAAPVTLTIPSEWSILEDGMYAAESNGHYNSYTNGWRDGVSEAGYQSLDNGILFAPDGKDGDGNGFMYYVDLGLQAPGTYTFTITGTGRQNGGGNCYAEAARSFLYSGSNLTGTSQLVTSSKIDMNNTRTISITTTTSQKLYAGFILNNEEESLYVTNMSLTGETTGEIGEPEPDEPDPDDPGNGGSGGVVIDPTGVQKNAATNGKIAPDKYDANRLVNGGTYSYLGKISTNAIVAATNNGNNTNNGNAGDFNFSFENTNDITGNGWGWDFTGNTSFVNNFSVSNVKPEGGYPNNFNDNYGRPNNGGERLIQLQPSGSTPASITQIVTGLDPNYYYRVGVSVMNIGLGKATFTASAPGTAADEEGTYHINSNLGTFGDGLENNRVDMITGYHTCYVYAKPNANGELQITLTTELGGHDNYVNSQTYGSPYTLWADMVTLHSYEKPTADSISVPIKLYDYSFRDLDTANFFEFTWGNTEQQTGVRPGLVSGVLDENGRPVFTSGVTYYNNLQDSLHANPGNSVDITADRLNDTVGMFRKDAIESELTLYKIGENDTYRLLNVVNNQEQETDGTQYRGYYVYDSARNFHATDCSDGYIGTSESGFFPLCDTDTDAEGIRHNYHFGMEFNAQFMVAENSNETFMFTGDDDFWLFIDGVLMLDIGGVHQAITGTINLGNSTTTVFTQGQATGNQQSMYTVARNNLVAAYGENDPRVNEKLVELFGENPGTNSKLAPGYHDLTIYYMERSTKDSNLRLITNLAFANLKVTKEGTKAIEETDANGNVKGYIPVDGTLVKDGDKILYTVTVENPSTLAATNVSFEDIAPKGAKFVPGSVSFALKSGKDAGTQGLTVNDNGDLTGFVNVPANDTLYVEFAAVVDGINTSGHIDTIANTVVVNEMPTPSDPFYTDPLDVEKTVEGNGNYGPGDVITYRVTVSNICPEPLYNINVSDSLIGQYGSWMPGSDSFINTLEPGKSIDLYFQYTVQPGDLIKGTVDNTVTARVSYHDNISSVTDTETVPVTPNNPGLEVEKAAVIGGGSPDYTNGNVVAEPGTTVAYYIRVTNTGDTVLKNIKVTDDHTVTYNNTTYPANTTIATIETLNVKNDATGETGVVVVGPLYYTIPADALVSDAFSNTGKATGTTPDGDDISDEDTAVTKIAADPKLVVNKLVFDEETQTYLDETTVEKGKTVTYKFEFINEGNVPLTITSVKDVITPNTIKDLDWINSYNGFILEPGVENKKTIEGQVTFPADIDVAKAVNTVQVYAEYTDPATGSVEQYDPYPETDSATVNLKDPVKPGIDVVKTISAINGVANNNTIPQVVPGDVITYAITVTNTGNCELAVELTDICDMAGVQLSESNFILAANGTKTVTATVTVPATAANASIVTNNVKAEGTVQATGETVEDEDEAYAVVKNENIVPAIDIKKSVNPTTAAPGQTVEFTITVTNIGNVDLENVVITDDKIFDGNAVSTSGWTQTEGTTGAYTIEGTLGVGRSREITYRYTVPSAFATGDSITNIAKVTADNPNDPSKPIEDTDNATITIGKSSSMDVTKVVSDRNAQPGDTVTYTITVFNNGTTDLTGVRVISDVLTKNGVTIAQPAEWQAVLDSISGTIKPGQKIEKEVTFTIPTDAKTNDKFVNTITVDSDETDPPITKTAETTIGNDIYSQVTISKVAVKGEINPGEIAEYMIVVTNNSGVTINDLVVYDIADVAGIVNDLTANGAYTVGELKPGEVWTKSVSVPTTDSTVGNVWNTAYLDNGGTFNPQDDTTYIKSDKDVVVVKNNPKLSIEKTAVSGHVMQGNDAVFTITVKNIGNVALNDVAVTDIFAGKWDNVAEASTAAPVIATLGVGEEKTFSFTYKVSENAPANSTITNVAYAESGDPKAPKVSDDASIIVDERPITPAPAISVDKIANTTEAQAGDKIYFQIAVANRGNVPLYNVNLTDVFTNSLGADLPEWALNCYTTLEVGQTWTSPMLEYVIPADTVGGTVFTNNIKVTANSVKDDPSTKVEAEDKAEVLVPNEPAVSITKVADSATVFAGNNTYVVYTINVKNEGNCVLKNVKITEALTGGTWSVPGTNTYGIIKLNSIPEIPELPIGATATLEYTYKVTQAAGTTIENTVTATPSNEGCDPAVAEEEVDVIDPLGGITPQILVTKTVTSGTAKPGETVYFQITVKNTGNVTLEEINLTDTFKKLAGATSEQTLSTTGWDLACNTILAPGESWRSAPLAFTVPAEMTGGEKYNNHVAVASKYRNLAGELITMPLGESDANVIVADVPALNIIKTANVAQAKIGDEVVYTIRVENTGNCNIANVEVTDSIAGGTWKENGVALSGAPVIANLEKGGSRTYTYTVTVPNNATIGGVYPNVATAKAGDITVSDDANITIAETPIQPAPSIEVTKNVNKTNAEPGETVYFWITVTNTGNVPLYNTTLSDVFTRTGATENIPTSAWNLSCKTTLAVGETWTSQPLTYVVPENAAGGEVFENTVKATAKSIVNGVETPVESEPAEASFTVNSTGDFTIEKSVIPERQVVGGDVFYTITVKNTGNVDLKDLKVEDEMLDKEWNVGNLAKGATYVITEKYTIDEDWDCNANPNITNVAVATAKPVNGGNTIEKQDTAVVTPYEIAPVSSIKIIKEVAGDTTTFLPGDTVYYTILVQNNGETDYQNLKVYDDKLDKTWTIAELKAGDTYLIPVNESVLVLSETAEDGDIVNTATLTDSENTVLDADDATITVREKPLFTVRKTAAVESAMAGEKVTYTIFVENTGNVALTNVRITDDIAGGTWATTDGTVLDAAPVIATLAVGGTATYTYTVAVPEDAEAGSTFKNTAVVTATPPTGGDITEDDDVDITVEETPVPSFTVSKEASTETANIGDTVYFWITITNTGDTDITNIEITDEFVRDSGTIDTNWTFENIPAVLKVNESKTFGPFAYTVPGNAANGEEFENTVTVTAEATVNGETVELEETDEATFDVDSESGIDIEKSVTPATQVVGGDVVYTIVVKNTGKVDLKDVVVNDEIIDKSWTVGNLAQGETQVITQKFTIPENWDCETTPEFENIAVVTGTPVNGGAAVTDRDSAVVTTYDVELVRDIRITKEVSGGTEYMPGDTVYYTIVVENKGEVNYQNLKVYDDKLDKTWTIAELKAGDTYLIPVNESVLVLSETAEDGDIVNTATLYDSSNEVLDTDDATITVGEEPLFTVRKTAAVESAKAGEMVTYTIFVQNTGNVPLVNVTITDDIEGGTWSTTEGEALDAAPVVTLLPVGGTATYNYTVAVPDDAETGSTFKNTAIVTATPPTGEDITEEDDVDITVEETPVPSINVTKEVSAETANIGDTVYFWITVTNTGDVDLSNIEIEDVFANTAGTVDTDWTFDVPAVLKVNESKVFGPFTYTVTADAADGEKFENTVTVSGKATIDDVTTTVEDEDKAEFTVDSDGGLVIEKSVTPETQKVGENVVYTIVVKNTGKVDLKDVVVNDQKINKTWQIGNLAKGETRVITQEFTIPANWDCEENPEFVNTAVVTGTPVNGSTPITDSDDAVVATYEVTPVSRVDINKEVVGEANRNPGDTVFYTIIVENKGETDFENLKVTDDKIGKTWIIAELKAGDNYIIPVAEATLTLSETQQPGEVINTAAVYDSGDNKLDEDSAVITVVEEPQLRVVKTAGVESAKAGDMVTYTIFVENIGNVALTNVRIDDSIVGGTWAELDGTALDAAPVIETLAVGGTATYTYTVAVPADAVAGTTINNVAIVRATPPTDSDIKEEDDVDITVDETPIIPVPSFTVTKEASAETANVGDNVYFWITVTNTGETDLTNITINDVFARTSGTIETDWAFDVPAVLKVNESKAFGPFTYTVPADAADGEKFENTVTVTADATVNGETETLPEQTDKAEFTVDKDNGLKVTKTVTPETQVVGGSVFYTITVENTGNTTLNDVTVTDEMLGEEWTIAKLESGKTEVFTKEYIVPEDWDCTMPIKNVAIAEATPEGEDEPISDSDTVELKPTEAPVNDEVRITKRVSGNETNYKPGDTVVYTILVENIGEVDHKDLKVTDDKIGKTWTIAELKAGETFIIPVAESSLVLSETQVAGEFINTATVVDKDGNKLDEDSEVINVLEKRELSLVKAANVENAEPGDKITYTILVTNTGNTELTDVTVKDELGGGTWVIPETIPDGVGEVSVTDLGVVTVDSIAVGAEALQLNYNYIVPETVKSGETITNVAVASATDTDPVKDSAVVEVEIPGLEVTKTAATPVVQPGSNAEFYITVTNTGDTDLTNVSVTDILPVEYNGEKYEANEVFAVIEKLEAGKHETFKVAYAVPADAAAETQISNTATATAENGVTDQDSDSVTVKVPVQDVSDFTIRKSANVYAAKPGSTVVYNIIVTNTGNTVLTGIVVSDVMPVIYNNAAYEANAPFATIDTLQPGASQSFEVSCIVPANAQAGSQVVNKATADPAELDPKTTECVIQALAADQPNYSIVKVANVSTVHPGDTVTYSIVVTNTGNCDLVDFSVHDDLLNKTYYVGTLGVGQIWKTNAGEASYKIPDNAQDAANISNTASGDVLGATNTVQKSTWTLVVQDDGKGVYAPETGDEDTNKNAAVIIIIISSLVLVGCLLIPKKTRKFLRISK